MNNQLRNLKWWKTGWLFFALYTFYPLFFFPQYYFNGFHPAILVRLFFQSYLWIILTPFMLWLGRRYSIVYPFRLKNIVILSLSPFLFAAAHVALFMLFWQGLLAGAGLVPPVRLNIVFYMFTSATVFCAAILGFHQAFNYFRKFRDREFRLQEAELQLLKSQLHPHFLFNSLNAISALIYISPRTAHETVSQLSDLLRASLKSGKTQEVSLEEELDFLNKYVQIHRMLMGRRLDFVCNIEPEIMSAAVPNMILQPIVENSIQHGIAPLEQGGRIELSVSRQDRRRLLLQVTDNGKGLPEDKIVLNSNGIGLVNTKARLTHLYGDSCDFKITEPPGGGVSVSLAIPYRDLNDE